MITPEDKRLHDLWTRRGQDMSLRELEIAATALGELHALGMLQGKYPEASFAFELHEAAE